MELNIINRRLKKTKNTVMPAEMFYGGKRTFRIIAHFQAQKPVR